MKPRIRVTSFVFGLLLLGGCATSRSVLDIQPPGANTIAPSNGKDVYILAARDRRIFEPNPTSPNIPSLDPSEEQSDAIKRRSVGRKRNGFGRALGDIVLKEGQTVESLAIAAMRQAFVEKGYRLLDNGDKASTYIVDADIAKFWSWMNPGFAAITLSTEISTDLSIKSPENSARQTVSIKVSDTYQTGMEGNWIEVLNKALRTYVDELKTKLE